MADKPFDSEYEVKAQARFRASLAKLVPHPELAEETLNYILFTLRYFPDQGRDTGRSNPFPIYALTFSSTENRPGMVVFYTFSRESKTVILFSAQSAHPE